MAWREYSSSWSRTWPSVRLIKICLAGSVTTSPAMPPQSAKILWHSRVKLYTSTCCAPFGTRRATAFSISKENCSGTISNTRFFSPAACAIFCSTAVVLPLPARPKMNESTFSSPFCPSCLDTNYAFDYTMSSFPAQSRPDGQQGQQQPEIFVVQKAVAVGNGVVDKGDSQRDAKKHRAPAL